MTNLPVKTTDMDAFIINYEPLPLTQTELDIIHRAFNDPSVVKYLKNLEQDLLNDYNSLSLSDLIKEPEVATVKLAFVKGGVNLTQTLLSIHKSSPIKK